MADESPLAVDCICCHCEAVFDPLEVTGGYLRRTCPSCGAVLDEPGYDVASGVVLDEIDSIKREISRVQAEMERWHAWANRLRWAIFKPIRRIFTRKAERTRTMKDKLLRRREALKSRRDALARSRYYTGEWFQRTRIPLERTGTEPYRIKVNYCKGGSWRIDPMGKLALGIVSEFRVFQRLLDCVRDPSSPLFGAQVVPNIYLPRVHYNRKAAKHWTQIDCLLLTRQAAFVIEVKHRRKRMVALYPFEEVRSAYSASLADAYASGELDGRLEKAGFEDESFSLKQNSNHVAAFDEECEAYPRRRIYEQVVYVGTKSFYTDCRRFVDNVNVSCLGRGKPDFADIIEAECAILDAIITDEELAKLGESLVTAYGDLDQKRRRLHGQRLGSLCVGSDALAKD